MGRSTTAWADRRRDPVGDAADERQPCPTPATSPTARTTSSVSTTCATTWPAPSSCVQRGHPYAIVDEVDSILIDEARTPLIISGPTRTRSAGTPSSPRRTSPRPSTATPTTRSTKKKHHLGAQARYHQGRGPPRHREPLQVGQHAHLVPAPTPSRPEESVPRRQGVRRHRGRGAHRQAAHRPHAGRRRRYDDGLHQAIEAKEGVTVREEYQTLATVTLQNYFRLYEKLGHDGHGDDRGLGVQRRTLRARRRSPFPTNLPMVRIEPANLVYRTERRQVRRRRRGHRRAAPEDQRRRHRLRSRVCRRASRRS